MIIKKIRKEVLVPQWVDALPEVPDGMRNQF
jgi:hypothetical protein